MPKGNRGGSEDLLERVMSTAARAGLQSLGYLAVPGESICSLAGKISVV